MVEKSLAKNSVYNVLYKGLNVIFPLATSMYVSRILLSDGVGRVASAKNLVTYFTLLAALGLPTYGTKKIAELRNNSEKLSVVFSELFIINSISTLICSFCYYSIIFFAPVYRESIALYSIVGLQVIMNVFNIDWFYQGTEEYGYIMIRSLAVKIISFLFILAMVHDKNDYLYYAFASVMGVVLNYVLNVMHLRKIVHFTFRGLCIKRHIGQLLILFSTGIAIEIYTLSDITMLTFMTDRDCVGYYSNAISGVKTIKEMIVAVCAVFLPRLSFYYARGEKSVFIDLAQKGIKILLFFSVPAAVGCFLLADRIVIVLFGESFRNAILTVKILSMSIITIGISNYIGYQILIVIGKEKTMLCNSILGATLNIILNLVLIRMLQHNGAAIASMITEVVVCVLYLGAYAKYIGLRWLPRYICKIIMVSAIMGVCVWTFLLIKASYIVSCFGAIVLGGIIYMAGGLIAKNEMAVNICRQINSKVLRNRIK